MLQTCKDLFLRWNENVSYCHWKSNEHLIQGLNGETDLDVFVLPSDKENAENALLTCGYIKFLPQKGCRYPNVDEWIGFDYETGKLVHVHLHYQIITGTKFVKEYVFPLDEEVISSRILDINTGVYIMHPELEAIILFCRIALKANNKNNIKPSNDSQREIDYVKKRIKVDSLLELCNRIIGTLEGSEICQIISMDKPKKEDWYIIYRIAEKWLSPYRKHSKIVSKVKHFYNKARLGYMSIYNKKFDGCYVTRKTLSPRGISICFIGADGSGKSSVTQDLTKWLTWKINAKRFYLGSGDGYNSVYKRVLSQLRRKGSSSNTKQRHVNNSEGNNCTNTLMAQIGILLLSREYMRVAKRALKQVRNVFQYSRNGSIAMLDRFPQIQFAGIYDGPKIESLAVRKGGVSMISQFLAKKEFKLLMKAQLYQPDLVFRLLLPAEESMRRKPFEDRLSVERKSQITSKLEFEKSIVYDIDATQDYQTELLSIKRIIWKHLLQNLS